MANRSNIPIIFELKATWLDKANETFQSHVEGVIEARRKECVLSGRKMSGRMVESPAEKNKSPKSRA